MLYVYGYNAEQDTNKLSDKCEVKLYNSMNPVMLELPWTLAREIQLEILSPSPRISICHLNESTLTKEAT